MLTTRERFALTFCIEQYVKVNEGFIDTAYFIDGSYTDVMIKQSLRLLFDNFIFTPKQLSDEIFNNTKTKIKASYLKRFSEGNFQILNVIDGVKLNENRQKNIF